jgi:hypothetical protein
MKLISILLSICSSLFFVGIVAEKDSAVRSSDYFPLEVGAEWTYRYVSVEGDTDEPTVYTSTVKNNNFSFKGNSYLTLEQKYKNTEGSMDITIHMRRGSDGSTYMYMPQLLDDEVVAMPAEVAVGDTWQVEMAGSLVVVGLAAEVETPARTYTNCLVVKTNVGSEEDPTTMKTYYAKGIGAVATFMNGSLQYYFVKYEE